jgi:hypothetical protein
MEKQESRADEMPQECQDLMLAAKRHGFRDGYTVTANTLSDLTSGESEMDVEDVSFRGYSPDEVKESIQNKYLHEALREGIYEVADVVSQYSDYFFIAYGAEIRELTEKYEWVVDELGEYYDKGYTEGIQQACQELGWKCDV